MTRAGAACLACLAGFGALLVAVTTSWGPLRTADLDVARAVVDPARESFWKVVSEVGQPLTWQVLAIVTAIVLAVRKRPLDATRVALTVLLASPLNNLIKALVGRHRPTVVEPLTHAAGLSFPSGHAMTSIVGVLVLASVWTTVPRVIAVTTGTVVVGLIGFSRLALGVHYLSDVLAGWLLGAAWVLTTAAATTRVRRWRGSASPDRLRRTPGP